MASQEILLFLGSLKPFPLLLGTNHQGKEEQAIYLVCWQSCISHSSRFTSWDRNSNTLIVYDTQFFQAVSGEYRTSNGQLNLSQSSRTVGICLC